jgi:hypothetical protein
MKTIKLKRFGRNHLKRICRVAGRKKGDSGFYDLVKTSICNYVANIIITTGPVNRRFGSPDTFNFTKMTKIDTINGLSSQRHWGDESFSVQRFAVQ